MLAFPAEMKRQDRVGSIDFDTLAKTAPATAAILADVERAKIAHDNIDSMGEIERKLRQFGGGAVEAVGMAASGTGQLLDIAQRKLIGGFAKVFLPKPMAGGDIAAESLAGPLIGEGWRGAGGGIKGFARDDLMAPAGERTFGDDVAAGLGQVVGQIAMLPLARGAGLYAQGADVMAEKVAGDDANQGMKDLAILGGAAVTGITEKWALDKLLGPLAVPIKNQIGAAMARIGIAAAAEGGQEFSENVLQDALRIAMTNREAEINIGQSAYEGGVGAAVGGIVRSVVEAGLHIRARGVRGEQQAEQGAEFLADLNKLAAADKLLARDPETFEAFVAQAAEGSPVQKVFIDGNTLMQSGVAEQIAAVSPSVAAQLETAVATGGQVAIPVEEYATRIAPTEYAQSLLDHLKTDPEGFSRAEAQEYMQSGAAQELEAEAERILAQKEGDDTFKASADAVKAQMLADLNALGRFAPAKNEADATVFSAYYAVRAAQMGITPEELFARRPLRFAAESVAGGRELAQALASQPTKGWKHSVDGADAATILDYAVKEKAPRDAGPGDALRPLSDYESDAQAPSLEDSIDDGWQVLNQSAYHGSPYKFSKFSLDHMGNGEGAQAFGWGLYFAGSRDVAEYYRGKLSGDLVRPIAINFSNAGSHFEKTGGEYLKDGKPVSKEEYGHAFRDATAAYEAKDKGQLYEVDIPEDDTMLLWDKPLSEQPEKVRVALSDYKFPDAKMTGGEMYAFIRNEIAESSGQRGRGPDFYKGFAEKASKALNSLGVSGIKYLDGSSRTGGEGSYNYVIFDDAAVEVLNTYYQNQQAPRGSFNPETFTISLLKGADLSTALHEGAHFFFENDIALADELAREARAFGIDTLTTGERQILADVSALLEWHGINGDIDAQLAQWVGLDFEEKRAYHERTAESFESYLFEGKAPSIELQPYFQKFRAWMVSVYRSLKDFLSRNPEAGKLNDDVRAVFDRMLASSEQIVLAEQGRSMMPLFASPEQAGMTPDEFAAYQALGNDATQEAVEDLQARGLRDMQWLHNARGRMIKKLQREAREQRAAVEMDVRREVMSQPVYRAWAFLTGKLNAEDKVETPKPVSSSPPAVLDETMDSLFVAIGKLGGLNKDEVIGAWGTDPADKPQSGVFGKPLWRIEGGLSIDGMAEALAQYGYLAPDENGKVDLAEFERAFDAELRGSPVYSSAYAPEQFFTGKPGEQLENPAGLVAGRLHLDSLAEIGLPAEVINALKARRMTAKEGLHPDIVADLFGFSSGDELVRQLAAAETPREAISALTDIRMLEQFGDLSSPEAIEKAADKAIHNDARARFVATEANALAQAVGQRKILASAAREFAAAMIARLKVRDIRPGQYANAEVRAAKAAEKASKAGDLATAAAEKRNQLIQNYATRAAYDAQDDVASGLRYLKRFEGQVKGLDADYIEQIDGLLERFDLRKGQSLKAIDQRKSFAEWLAGQREQGLEPDVPPELENEANRKSYKDMTVEEFRGLLDTVKQIEHLGRLKHRLLTARDERKLAAIVEEAEASIREHGGKERPVELEGPSRVRSWLEGLAAGHRKFASLLRQMDGGLDNGPMWRALGRGMNEASTSETVMNEQATMRLAEIFKPILAMPGGTTGDKRFIPAINASLTRGGRLAVALNWGNETNRQRVLDGDRWSPAQANAVLSTLTREEMTFVQNVWDFIDSYWPAIEAKEKRVTGRAPEKVPASPFVATLADGTTMTLRGGYYPIKYDANRDDKAEKHDAAAIADDMKRGAVTRSTTRRGHTKARVENVKRPVKKSLDVITQHVSEVTHDLAWHEWLIDANRLIDAHKINHAIRDHYGPEVLHTMKDALQAIATADIVPQTKMDQALLYLRANVSRSTMGLSLTTAFLQPFGLTQSMVRIGPKHVLRGMARWGGDIARFQNAAEWIGEKSDFMRLRSKTFNRELHEIKGRVTQGHSRARQIYDASLFMLMQKMQMVADIPTWIGAYEKALAENHDDATAAALADQAVLDSQGGGQTKDTAELQRKHPMLTMFYSYFNVTLNLAAESTAKTDFRNPLAVAGWLSDMALLMVIPALGPALLLHLLKGGGDDDDDDPEAWAKRLAEWQAGYLLGTVIGLRELSGAVSGFDYAGPPAGRIIADLGKLKKQAEQGELDEGLALSAVQVMGAAAGIPTVQIVRSWRGWNAWEEGDAPPTSVLLGPPPRD